MSDLQTSVPNTDNPAVVGNPAEEGSVLTGKVEGTPPLAASAPTELPHAWMNGMTTEQKADADLIKSVSKFEKGIPDLVGSYATLEKKLSQAVSVPNETATEEEKARYRTAIGVPEKSEDYKLGEVSLPEGMTVDEAMQKDFLKLAHDAGLSNAQAGGIYQWYMKTYGEQVVAAQKIVKTTQEEANTALRNKLGAGYDAAQTYMERAFAAYGTEHVAKLFAISGVGNDPEVIEMFMKIGKSTSEHGFVDGSRGEHLESGTVGNRTDEQIAKQMYPDKKEGQ